MEMLHKEVVVFFKSIPSIVVVRKSWFIAATLMLVSVLYGCNGGGSGGTESLAPSSSFSVTADDSEVPQNTPASIKVVGNDHLPPSNTYSIDVDHQPGNGTVKLENDNSITYIPDTDFVGTDRFSYRITDESGNSAVATVTVKVYCEVCPEIRMTLAWKDNLQVKGYLVYYSESQDANPVQVADTPIAIYSEDIGRTLGLYGGESICFRVRSYNKNGISELSDPVCGTA